MFPMNQEEILGDEEKFHEAMKYAFFLLSQRERSKRELEERLQKRGYFSEVIQMVIHRLEELEYLNDIRFAENWTEMKLKRKPCGKKLLREELKKKGIEPETIDQILEKVFLDVDEELMAKELVEKKIKGCPGLDEKILYRRLQGYLLRRGFPPEMVYKILRGLRKIES